MSSRPKLASSQTDNDEAIAEALARDEQEIADAQLARKIENELTPQLGNIGFVPPPPAAHRPVHPPTTLSPVNCPHNHGLTPFNVSQAQRVTCDVCHRRLQQGDRVYSCVICNFDVCAACKDRGGVPPPTPPSRAVPAATSPSGVTPFPIPQFVPPSHMCIVPCEVGKGVCVEMMIDTGAQSSVISMALARRLNLTDRLDTTEQGIAAGVGQARIMGKLRNVNCLMGHVEFAMDFMVLDVQDMLLLLGLDQMRKYKCIVDLEKEVLIFGGAGGVEVHMLPPDEQHITLRRSLGEYGCSVS